MLFESEISIVFFTFIGVTVLWGKFGREGLRPYLLPMVFDLFFRKNPDGPWRLTTEFVVFAVVGIVLALGLAEPSSPAQAFAAGLGWTGLVTRPPD